MNTIFLTLTILVSTMMHNESNITRNEVKQQIERTLSAPTMKLPLETDQSGLVRASIRVDEHGKLHLLESNYSHKELKDLLETALNGIEVQGSPTEQVLYYEFRFEKH
ncbi:MAG: hypothetical protein EP314_03755 [Bacteroidetes bacterium]|nr:MAG: hypothetical protein EP314_03755 [Bacteroidota bacterium]